MTFSLHITERFAALLSSDPPDHVSKIAAELRTLGLDPGVLLDGDPYAAGQSFDAVVLHRLHALIRLAGHSVHGLTTEVLGYDEPLRASSLRGGKLLLTRDHVDRILAALALPVGRLFAPVLGPHDLALLRQVQATPGLAASLASASKAERTAAQLVVDERDAITFLARARGEYVPSRPKKALTASGAGGMLNRAGCRAAVRSLCAQGLLNAGPPLTLTPAGLALVGATTTPKEN